MSNTVSGLNTDDFIKNYWQKKPLVIRQCIPNFEDFLDENDLAGLAMEPEVDSRIVRHIDGKWDVFHGPFDDFQDPCQGQWTLLVQAVDRYVDAASELMRQFAFVPYWRMDDLMISYAVSGAGVGAHVDQYDVFLLQGKGKRRWQVGEPNSSAATSPHKDLCQVEAFNPIIDVELEPGDALYIPPNWPHAGTTIEDALTYSIGFRAPDQTQLTSAVADMTFNQNTVSKRFSDPDITTRLHPSMVVDSEMSKLNHLLMDMMETSEWQATLVRHLSQQHMQFTPLDTPINTSQLEKHLEQGVTYEPVPGLRPLTRKLPGNDHFHLFIDGESFRLPKGDIGELMAVIDTPELNRHILDHNQGFALLPILATLISKGYWITTEEEE